MSANQTNLINLVFDIANTLCGVCCQPRPPEEMELDIRALESDILRASKEVGI